MTTDAISPDLKTTLRRLKLSRMLDTLPERLVLARQQKMPHQDLLLLVLSDEVSRRESLAVTLRVQRARLEPGMRLEAWDASAKVTLDRALLNELTSLRFLDAHAHVAIVGPVGVGKTFLAHALGHIACRRAASVLALRTDQMLKTLKHARLDNSYEAEQRIDAPHARPRQRAVEERRREAPNGLAGARRLLLQRRDVAEGIDAARGGIVRFIDRAAARRLPRMRFNQQPALVEAHELLIGPRRQGVPHVSMRPRIERLGDDGALIARDLRFAPQRDVVGRGRRGE